MRRSWWPRASARWWVTRGWLLGVAAAYLVLGVQYVVDPNTAIGYAPPANGAAFVVASGLLAALAVVPEADGLRVLASAASAFATGSRVMQVVVAAALPSTTQLAAVVAWTMLTTLVPFTAGLTQPYATRRRRRP